MAPIALEDQDHVRDAAFNKALHGKSAEEKAGLRAMLKKDPAAQKAAIDEYFKHWDNKAAGAETAEIREVGTSVQLGTYTAEQSLGEKGGICYPYETVRPHSDAT